jgi:hypothetical protein
MLEVDDEDEVMEEVEGRKRRSWSERLTEVNAGRRANGNAKLEHP